MFSSLLPEPKVHTLHSIRVVLPELKAPSKKLVLAASEKPLLDVTVHPSTNAKLLVSSDGSLDYTKSVLSNSGLDKKAQASFEDTIPLKQRYPNLKHHFPRYTLQNCPDDSLKTCLEQTREVVNRIIAQQNGDEKPQLSSSLMTYTPQSLDEERGRNVEVVNYQEDPLLPPKFKLRKNRHKAPSPPPPVLKKPPAEKVTKEMKDKWSIPSVVSNWKNNQGFAISLNKRTHAASGGLAPPQSSINIENFALLSLALESADYQAREEIKARNEERKLLAAQERQRKELELKDLVEKTRSSRGGVKRHNDGHSSRDNKKRRS